MNTTKTKVAYALAYSSFFVSFSIWLVSIVSVFFPSGKWANPIQFPNLSTLALFLSSGIASSIICMILGLDYLGVVVKLRSGIGNLRKTKAVNMPIQSKQTKAGEINEIKNDFVLVPLDGQAEQLQESLQTIVTTPDENELVAEKQQKNKS